MDGFPKQGEIERIVLFLQRRLPSMSRTQPATDHLDKRERVFDSETDGAILDINEARLVFKV